MIRHDVRLDESDLSITLLSLILSHIAIICVGSTWMMVHLLWLALNRLKMISHLIMCIILLLLLLRHMILSRRIRRLHLLNLLLLYLIGSRVCWVLWLSGMCIFTSLLTFARTVLRLISSDWKLLWALRWRIWPLSVIALMRATLLRLGNVSLRAGWEVTIGWKSASLV